MLFFEKNVIMYLVDFSGKEKYIMWVLFVIIYALMKGARECMKKGALKKSSANEILFLYTLFGFILTIPFAGKAFALKADTIFFIFLKSAACCTAWAFSIYALKKLSVGIYSILALSGVFFTTFFGVFVLRETFTVYNLIGLILVVTGLFMLYLKREIKGKITVTSVAAVILCCFFNSLSSLIDKIMMQSIEPAQLQFWFMFFTALIYFSVFLIRREKISLKPLKTNIWIPLMSISLIVGDFLLFAANASKDSKVIVISLIVQLSVITSISLSHFIFKEKNVFYKLLCALIVISGIVIPVVFN